MGFISTFCRDFLGVGAESQTDGQAQSQSADQSQQTNAPAQSDSSAANNVASPPASDTSAQASPSPRMPPAHDDPYVGQNKVVDPNDKSCSITGTLDPPRVTGVQCDPPKIGPVNPQGSQLQYPADKPDSPGSGGPPATDRGPGWKWDSEGMQWVPWPAPAGEGYKWNKNRQDWDYAPSPGDGYVWDKTVRDWVKAPTPAPQAWEDLAPQCDKYLTDHHFEARKGEEIVPGDKVCDMYLDRQLLELRATTGSGQAAVRAALVAAFPDLQNYPIQLARLVEQRWEVEVGTALVGAGAL